MAKRPAALLTRAKAARVAARRPAAIKGKPLNPPVSVAAKYRVKLEMLVDGMAAIARTELAAWTKSEAASKHFGQDESVAHSAARLTKRLEQRFAQLLGKRPGGLAEWLVGQVDKASSSSLHASLKDLSGGLSLPTTVMTGAMRDSMIAAVNTNVDLITSLSSDFLTDLKGAVYRSVTSGNGLADLQPLLESRAEITKRRARMIAHDQTRKVYGRLNDTRMKALGLSKFEWVHSGGGRHPRKLHQGYDGQIFDLDRPPIIDESTGERGIPGQAVNCRCKMVPVLAVDEAEA